MSIKNFADQNVNYSAVILNPTLESDWLKIKELQKSEFVFVSDQIESQIGDLIKSENPERTIPSQELDDLVQNFLNKLEKDKYGNWVFFLGKILWYMF
ncbi:hypothetical protein V8V91_07820 [Algoriphagus halophilus]|uniref:hypothetical protein n=1 Tax=Algoriphagus halophilus TaxID=226505 RepID=UPI00358F410E